MRASRVSFRLRSVVLLTFMVGSVVLAQQEAEPSDEAQNIIAFLNQTIAWYQQLSLQQQVVSEPSEAVFLGQNRDLADQVAKLSFDFARGRAPSLSQTVGDQVSENTTPDSLTPSQGMIAAAAREDAATKKSEHEIEGLKRQLGNTTGAKRSRLESAIADDESELALHQARAETLHGLIGFSAGARAKGSQSQGLPAQIEELAHAVPSLEVDSKNLSARSPAGASAPVTTFTAKPQNPGLLALASAIFSLRHKVQVLQAAIESTDALADSSHALRAPLLAELRALTQRGDALTSQPDSQNPAELAQHRNQVEGLTADFKKLSTSVIPLAKQAVLLELYKRNLAGWLGEAQSQYSGALKSFALRMLVLGVILGLVLAASHIWIRATFRYVQDQRRRLQFLLIRRIVVWSLIAVIVFSAFASELGSLATFAGLLTAGLAVALQNVILSVVGYFFLVGKYGVHLGDRVQVAGITGDIIDIGLFRLRLMEIGGFGSGIRPTGRVVVFPNSVVFQTSGLFRQAPGARFVWHEVKLTLGLESDYQDAEKRMLDAVNSVFASYKEGIEQQQRDMAQALAPLTVSTVAPESRLSFVPAGLAVSIRYPVDLVGTAEIDDRIVRAVLDAARCEPRLRIVGSGVATGKSN